MKWAPVSPLISYTVSEITIHIFHENMLENVMSRITRARQNCYCDSCVSPCDSCRCITGCLRPTNVDSLYVLAGIAPPGVRRSVASRTERRRQADDTRHPCHNHQPAPSRLKSRKSFLHEVQPLSQPPQTARLTLWEEQRSAKQHLAKLPIPTSEQLAPGHKSEWKLWKSLNRLRTGMGRSKTNMSKWGYADTADTACECGTSEQSMQHLLRCPLL